MYTLAQLLSWMSYGPDSVEDHYTLLELMKSHLSEH